MSRSILYLEWVIGATNYAYGGAESGDGSTDFADITIPDVGGQIDQFIEDRRAIARDSLVVLWIGGNDLNGTSASGAASQIGKTIRNVREHLEELIELGALQILVPNVPLLGEVPQHNKNASERRQQNKLVTDYNEELADLISFFRAGTPEVRFIEVDTAGYMAELLEDPAAFGFTNTRDQAHTPGAFGGIFGGSTVDNPNEYVFWDDLHPTGPVHEIIGARAAEAVNAFPIATVSGLSIVGDDVEITFPSKVWGCYSLLQSSDLETWIPVVSDVAGTGETVTFTHPGGGAQVAGFYRVVHK